MRDPSAPDLTTEPALAWDGYSDPHKATKLSTLATAIESAVWLGELT